MTKKKIKNTEKYVWVDPPSGWRHGFPAILPPGKTIQELLKEHKYPDMDARYVRQWEASEEEIKEYLKPKKKKKVKKSVHEENNFAILRDVEEQKKWSDNFFTSPVNIPEKLDLQIKNINPDTWMKLTYKFKDKDEYEAHVEAITAYPPLRRFVEDFEDQLRRWTKYDQLEEAFKNSEEVSPVQRITSQYRMELISNVAQYVRDKYYEIKDDYDIKED